MECFFLFISSERQNEIIYEELIKAADELKTLNQKLPRPILKSLSLKPSNDEEFINDSEVAECTYDWEGQIPVIGCEFPTTSDEFYYNDYFRLAEQLHKICDEEIITGRTNMQIIWCVDKYAPCPSEIPEFYGAVERLKLWHHCAFTVVTKNESHLVDWSSVFSFEIVKSCEKIVNEAINSIWTGRLGLKLENGKRITEIGDVCLQTNTCVNTISKFNILSDSYILPVAELFEDVDIKSIPWLCIIPGSICQLKICHSNEPDEQQKLELLFAKITNRIGVGTLLRIHYSDNPPSLKHPTSIKTSSWKQTIADGQFTTTPSLQFKGYHQCQVFLLTSEGSVNKRIYAVGLQDVNSCGEDVMKLALSESVSLMDNDNDDKQSEDRQLTEMSKQRIYNLLKDTPELMAVHMAAMSHLLVHLPVNIRKCLQKTGQNINNLWMETKEELEYVTNAEIFTHLFMTRAPTCVIRSPNTVLEAEIHAPKESWPEYRALKEVEQIDLNLSTKSQGMLPLLPIIPEGAPVCFKADQLLKFFSNNGEPSEPISEKMVKFSPKGKNRFTRTFQKLNEVNNIKWPNSVDSQYHGINYNTSVEQENFDTKCCEMKAQWIVEETYSTCSKFQNGSMSSRKMKTSIKRPRSVVEADHTSIKSGSSYYTNSQFPILPVLLRRSPRKKVRLDTERSLLKASDLLKLENGSRDRLTRTRTTVRKVASSELSEFHARKLRNAVLTALESGKVNINSAIFKNCFRKLFAVCKPFVADVVGLGSTTRKLEKIAKSHVKQVIQFEELKLK